MGKKSPSSSTKSFSLEVSQNVKIAIVLGYSLVLLVFELFFPVSFLISTPFARLVYLIVQSLGITSLKLAGSSIIIHEVSIDFTDLCTGVPAITLAVLFMWVGSFSKRRILTATVSLILFNVLRSVFVVYLLFIDSYTVAMVAHNATYTALTVVVAALMVRSLTQLIPWRLFKNPLLNSSGKNP